METSGVCFSKGSKGFKQVNIIEVLSHIVNGINWTSYERQRKLSQQPNLERGTWETIEKTIWGKVMDIAKQSASEALQLALNNPPIVISGDCAWSHRRNASAASYVMIDFATNKIIQYFILTKGYHRTVKGKEITVHHGTYQGSSKGMEFEGFIHCVDNLEKAGVLKKVLAFVADEDGQVRKAFQEQPRLQQITIVHDPGHYGKNLKKALEKLFGKSKRFILFPRRVMNWWWSSLKQAIAYQQETCKVAPQTKEEFAKFLEMGHTKFKELWSKAQRHFCQQTCGEDCPCGYDMKLIDLHHEEQWCFLPEEIILCILGNVDVKTLGRVAAVSKQFYRIAHTPRLALFQKKAKEKKSGSWLDPIEDKVKSNLFSRLCESVEEECYIFAHPYHTCFSESFNFVRAMLTRKGLFCCFVLFFVLFTICK